MAATAPLPIEGAAPEPLVLHMPGACSRVALVALEEIGRPYRDRGVALMAGEQRAAPFREINPKGKVPVLVDGGATITELPIILLHLARTHPEANLLPVDATGDVALDAVSDLVWIAGALHPTANRIFRPQAVSATDAEGVRAAASALLSEHAEVLTQRLRSSHGWLGPRWSIVDTFAAWVFGVAAASGFPLHAHAELMRHRAAAEARPAFQAAVARERAAIVRDSLALPPGVEI